MNTNSKDIKNWIIGTCASDTNTVFFFRTTGTHDQVKELLTKMVGWDRRKFPVSWFDCGTESPEEIEEWPEDTEHLSHTARRLLPLRREMNGGALSGFDAREKHKILLLILQN